MDINEAILSRHAVRQYKKECISEEIVKQLKEYISICNIDSGLHMQLVTDEPKAFNSFLAHYGHFKNVSNYLAIIGKKAKNNEERIGYYGEKIVLKAQELGLNSCWVAVTYKKVKDKLIINEDEKILMVIAIGHGINQGKQHISKSIKDISNCTNDFPLWFKKGVEFALLAPTALNEQKFKLIYNNGKVLAIAGKGKYTKVDLGIIKLHFEMGSQKDSSIWDK